MLAKLFALAAAALIQISALAATLTGNYMADGRPARIAYLSLTQSGQMGSGNITITQVDSDASLTTRVVPIRLTVDGSNFALLSAELGNSFVASGRRDGQALVVTMPQRNSEIAVLRFSVVGEGAFNTASSELKEAVAVERQAVNQIESLSRELYNRVQGIVQSQMPSDLQRARQSLVDQQSALDRLMKERAKLQALAERRPMTCEVAYRDLGWEYGNQMGLTFNQTLGFSRNQFNIALSDLDHRIALAPTYIEFISKTAARIQQLLASRRLIYLAPKMAMRPGDEISAIAQYRKLADDAAGAIAELRKSSSEVVDRANTAMAGAKAEVESARASVICR